MTTHNTRDEIEEVVKDFLKKTDPNNYEVVDYTNVLNDNGESLLDTTWYPESPYELDRDSIADWLRTTLTQLNANRTAEMEAMVREIIAQADLTPYAEEHNGELVDCSFYQIYKGKIEQIAQAHGITIN